MQLVHKHTNDATINAGELQEAIGIYSRKRRCVATSPRKAIIIIDNFRDAFVHKVAKQTSIAIPFVVMPPNAIIITNESRNVVGHAAGKPTPVIDSNPNLTQSVVTCPDLP